MGAIKIGGLGEERNGAAALDGFEQRRGAPAEAEDAGVFGRAMRLRKIARKIQQRIGAQAGESRAGIALGFDEIQKCLAQEILDRLQ